MAIMGPIGPGIALAGAASGAAPAAGLLAGIPPLAVAGAIGGGLVNFFAARSRNKAIAKAAEESAALSFAELDEQTTRARTVHALQQGELAMLGAEAIGEATVSFRSSGQSVNRSLAHMSGLLTTSTVALEQQLEDAIEAAQTRKEIIKRTLEAQAESGQTPTLQAAAGGAIAGFNLGQSISQLHESLAHVKEMNRIREQVGVSNVSTGNLHLAIAASRNAAMMSRLDWFNQRVRLAEDRLDSMMQIIQGTDSAAESILSGAGQ